jgi:hypothetical protein
VKCITFFKKKSIFAAKQKSKYSKIIHISKFKTNYLTITEIRIGEMTTLSSLRFKLQPSTMMEPRSNMETKT